MWHQKGQIALQFAPIHFTRNKQDEQKEVMVGKRKTPVAMEVPCKLALAVE